MKRFIDLSLLFAFAIATACSNGNEPRNSCESRPNSPQVIDLAISNDKTSYHLSDGAVYTSLENKSAGPVYYDGDFADILKLVNGTWTSIGGWVTADGDCALFQVPANGKLNVPGMSLNYVGKQPGTYRFRYHLYADPRGKVMFIDALTLSPPFEVIQ